MSRRSSWRILAFMLSFCAAVRAANPTSTATPPAAAASTTSSSTTSTTNSVSDHHHHHHHYQHNKTITIQLKPAAAHHRDAAASSPNQPYRPKIGEILVKDSILYAQKPAAVRHLRRQLWPIMETTMDTIAKGVATGAKILNHMMRPNLIVTGDPVYVRRVPKSQPGATLHIKNVYMPMALTAAKRPMLLAHTSAAAKPPPPMAPLKIQPTTPTTKSTTTTTRPFTLPKPSHIVMGARPVNTISEDYVLRYSGAEADPEYQSPSSGLRTYSHRTKSGTRAPFTDMGLTGYRHFEATVLRELEEKEERRVEATMAAAAADAARPTGDGGAADWQPLMSVSSTLRPHEMSALHTDTAGLDIKPVHEDVQETKTGQLVAIPEQSLPPKASRYALRKPSRPTVVATVAPTEATKAAPAAAETSSTTVRPSTLDVPNYPDFFIQEKRHLQPVRSDRPAKSAAALVIATTTRTRTTTTTTVLPKAPAKRVRKPAVAPPEADIDLNGVLDFGRYRQHFQHIGATAEAPSRAGGGIVGDMETSQSQSQSRTVLVAGSRPQRVSNRKRPPVTSEPDSSEAAALPTRAATVARSRGSVKFGDRHESA